MIPRDIEAVENGVLSVAGHRLAYTRTGHGHAVVLLHGIPTSRYLWRQVTPLMVAKGFEVIAFDLLGYGESDKPTDADLGIKAQAELLREALRQMGWQGGTIAGHDIGGGVAQLMAINHPEMLDHLILVDSIAYNSFPEPGIARLKDAVWDGILGTVDFDLKKGLKKGFVRGMVHVDKITPDMIAAYERPFHGVEGRQAYLRAARSLRTTELMSRMQEVEKLSVPTLVVWGEKDVFQPQELGERLARSMPHGQFKLIAQAGHFLPEDAPDALANLMTGFMTSNPEP